MTEYEKLVEEIAIALCETNLTHVLEWKQMSEDSRGAFRKQAEAIFEVVQPYVILEDSWRDWEKLYPYMEHKEDLEITMHHVLTEPVCPNIAITGETSRKRIVSECGDTMAEAINRAMDEARKRLMERKNGS